MMAAGRSHPDSPNERGIALVMVLALVALVAVWAVQSADEDWVSLRRAENMKLASQVWLAVESGEALAMRMLAADDSKKTDSLDEDWAREWPAFAVDDGEIAGRIEDANRFLNLNDLINKNGQANPDSVAEFKRLFAALQLDARLVDALVDWMDHDATPFGIGGAEESAYADKPYRIKNAPLDSLDELRLVQGFDRKIVGKLADFVVVRSDRENSSVNINTAPVEVLLSLADNIPQADVEAIISQRKDKPFEDISQLTTNAKYPWLAKIRPGRLATASDAFVVRVEARFDRARLAERMLVARDDKGLRVVSRRKIPGLKSERG